MKNYYKTLGISQSSTREDIKKAYRKLAIKYHPDKNPGLHFAEQFKEINEAKQVLLNDLKKFQYDQALFQFLLKNREERKRFNFQFSGQPKRNKKYFFFGLFSSITVLITVAFYEIPAGEPAIDAPVITQIISVPEKKTLEPAITTKPKRVEDKVMQIIPVGSKVKKMSHGFYVVKKHTQKEVIIKPVVQSEPPKKEIPPQKVLTNESMTSILNDIRFEKEKAGSNSNCVQIIKSESSNIKNAFMLANFLRGRGYIISGREKTPAASNGVSINAKNDCILVTIGTL